MNTDSELRMKMSQLHLDLLWIGTKDTLPTKCTPGNYIVNLQDDVDSDGNPQGGTHWTAFTVEGGFDNEDSDSHHNSAYSDSFGFAPPSQVQIFLKDYRPLYYTRHQIQNQQGGHCGMYAVYFLYFMKLHAGVSMKERIQEYQKIWSEDVTKNQRLLEAYMKHATQKHRRLV